MVGILTDLGPSPSILAFNGSSPVFKTNIQKMTELPLILITVHLPQPSSHPPEAIMVLQAGVKMKMLV